MQKLKLNNGYEIPVLGLGTSQAHDNGKCVQDAIDVGYRHFDCAWFYANERELGKGLQDKLNTGTINREDLFITSKLWNNFHSKERVVPMLKDTLAKLQLDYIDLFLIHWPFGFKEDAGIWEWVSPTGAHSDVDYLETWEGMEECVRQGLARSIGISNFNSEQITRLLNVAQIKPVVNQIEVHPKLAQEKLIHFCKANDIVVTGYCPLGHLGSKSVVHDPKLAEIGAEYKKTSAQIILNYLVSLGISVIPKTVNKSRMIENMDIFDFKLKDDDVKYLKSLDNNERICDALPFKDHKYFPFNIEF